MAAEHNAAALLPPSESMGPRVRAFDPDASLVLVGCRGAGKRTLGFIAAAHLRRRLVTEDHFFSQVTGLTRGQFLDRHGPAAFAAQSADVFRQMLSAHPRRCVIECGMSSLAGPADAPALLRAYALTHPVVYVHREREHIQQLLGAADADALLRADPRHRQCSNYEYYNLYDPGGNSDETTGVQASPPLYHAKRDFIRFLDLLQGQAWRRPWAESPFAVNAVPPEFRPYSYALRLRLSDLLARGREGDGDGDGDRALWEALEARCDCIEFIVDTWPADVCAEVARVVAQIRRAVAVPIIYHVEELPRQERTRPLAERDCVDADLLELGLRLNVEYLSLDLQRSPALVRAVLASHVRGRTRILGNYWFTGMATPPWTAPVYLQHYEAARAMGCDIVRIARFGHSDASRHDGPDRLQAAVRAHRRRVERGRLQSLQSQQQQQQLQPLSLSLQSLQSLQPQQPWPPLVAFDYSVLGVQAPLQGRIFNPVKHPDLTSRRDHLAIVTQYARANMLLFLHGQLDEMRFYTVGARIASSITPVMHRAAFAYCGLRHTFRPVQCTTLHALRTLFLDDTSGASGAGTKPHRGSNNRTFGGATLAAPFKVSVRPLLQLESPHAAALGAVNVLLPLRGDMDLDGDGDGDGDSDDGAGGSGYNGFGSNTSPDSDAALLAHARARNRAGPCHALYGDNTDWTAVHKCLQRALSPRNEAQLRLGRAAGLVIGAGGMARAAIYALLRLGCRRIFVYNRTAQHAYAVAHHFNDWAQRVANNNSGVSPPTAAMPPVCHVLASVDEPWPADTEPPTMVISCVPTAAQFRMPPQWLGSSTGGVVVELAYDTLVTPLLAQMREIAVSMPPTAPPWVIVDGLEVVSEMAIASFELLTGRIAPARLMRSVCRKAWTQQQRGLPLSAIPLPEMPLFDADQFSDATPSPSPSPSLDVTMANVF